MADTDEHKPEATAVKGGGQEQHEAGLQEAGKGVLSVEIVQIFAKIILG